MRTVLIILGGFVLLALCLGIGRMAGRAYAAAFWVFAAVWTLLAALNMWVGVTQAGYSFMEELPIFLGIVLIPVAAGFLVQKKLAAAQRDA